MEYLVEFSTDARKKMKAGCDLLSNAVKSTLGARGRNVIIYDDFKEPHVTKDGITVAKNIMPKDKIEAMGAMLVRQASAKTAELAGDGTTTAVVLAQSMISEGIKFVESGANPMDLKRGIDKSVSKSVDVLKELSEDVTDNKTLLNIATISANGDANIGGVISEIYSKIGKDGTIEVENGNSYEITAEYLEGVELNSGFTSPYFINRENESVVLENTYILLCEDKISNLEPLYKILESIAKEGASLLIISELVEPAALTTLIANKARGLLNVCVVKAPDYGDMRIAILEDVAVITGGTLIAKQKGLDVSKATLTDYGRARKVVISKHKCLIIGAYGDEDEINKRAEVLKEKLKVSDSEYEQKKLKERINRLTKGVAILKVGGYTETEITEKKDRVDDAVCATRAALEEGYVAGGGVTFLEIANSLKISTENEDERLGQQIVLKALKAPFKQILENGGLNYGEYVAMIENSDEYGVGVNIKTGNFENLFKAGVIDPTKVLRVALENAASVAGMFLTTECCIVP